MKKKIGIVTLVGNFNYGNRLQNFALQEAIKELGFVVDTLKVVDTENKWKKIIKKQISYLKIFIKSNSKINDITRSLKIEKFTSDYIVQSEYIIPIQNDSDIDNYYYGFVVGSDQVWNPNYKLDENYFLNFTKKKKISYAASIGLSNIDDQFKESIINALSSFHAVSVREKSTVSILQKDLNFKVEHVLDPTFLLTKKKWEEYLSDRVFKLHGKRYILLYFLGDINKEIWEQAHVPL